MKIYDTIGPQNTEPTLELALGCAMAIEAPIVIATTGGSSAVRLCELAREANYKNTIAVVTHCCGFKEGVVQEVPGETLELLRQNGCKVVTAAHVLSGVERSFAPGIAGPATLMAQTLRMFSAGMKVCVEIACMAMDAGALPFEGPVVAIGGTARGADTAVIMTPQTTARILNTRIHELLCMPR